MHPSKGVQKNMLKAWDFTTYTLNYRCFDNNFQKNILTNILETGTEDTFDSCFNGRIMLRELTYLNFKTIPSLLAAREISLLEFSKLCCIQRHILDPARHLR